MNKWIAYMYLFSVVGAMAGLFWPILVSLWRHANARIYKSIGLDQDNNVKLGSGDISPPSLFRKTVELIAFPVTFLILAVTIASIAAAVGFGAFLQSQQTRDSLQALGSLSYFFSFTYGFSAASLVAEPMKKI